MREQRDAAAGQRPAQRRLGEQAVEAEAHHAWSRSICEHEARPGAWKSGPLAGVGEGPVREAAVGALDHRRQPEPQHRVARQREQRLARDDRLERDAVVGDAGRDLRRQRVLERRHAFAVAGEAVHRPFAWTARS